MIWLTKPGLCRIGSTFLAHLQVFVVQALHEPPLPSPGFCWPLGVMLEEGSEPWRADFVMQNIDPQTLNLITSTTIGHYDASAESFWQGTKDHDVRQNMDALLRHIPGEGPYRILDLGCGPGRDVLAFRDMGHEAVGLDGAAEFVAMARKRTGCEVWQQNFLQLDLPEESFDGIFANAVLFHIPFQELPRVLTDLRAALKTSGVLFSSNPRGADNEGWNGQRYGSYLTWETWRQTCLDAGYRELEHYYRPPGKPRDQQPWLASVWGKGSESS